MRCAAHCPLEASWRTENGDHFTCLVMQFALFHALASQPLHILVFEPLSSSSSQRLIFRTCYMVSLSSRPAKQQLAHVRSIFRCRAYTSRHVWIDPVSTRRPCAQHTVTRTYVLVTSPC